MHLAIIAFGANIGDPKARIAEAINKLSSSFKVEEVSSLYRTRAVGGPPGQPDFLNGAAIAETDLSPDRTMKILLDIEAEMGRVRVEKWGPRIIDLDLLDHDGAVISGPDLILPHPHLHERAFVLAPLAEIAPQWRHPVTGKTAVQMMNDLGDDDRAVILGKEKPL